MANNADSFIECSKLQRSEFTLSTIFYFSTLMILVMQKIKNTLLEKDNNTFPLRIISTTGNLIVQHCIVH